MDCTSLYGKAYRVLYNGIDQAQRPSVILRGIIAIIRPDLKLPPDHNNRRRTPEERRKMRALAYRKQEGKA